MGRKNSINSRKLMIIKIISIGNKLNTWEQDSINFYLKQLPKNLKIEFVNLKSHQNPNYSESEVMKKEQRDFYDLEGLWGEKTLLTQQS